MLLKKKIHLEKLNSNTSEIGNNYEKLKKSGEILKKINFIEQSLRDKSKNGSV